MNKMMGANWKAIAEPFKPGAHKFKVQASTKDKSKSLAVFYIDARDVQDRLDSVVGPENWSDKYEVIAVGNPWAVQCTLTVGGVTKQDVGEGKAPKDAYSDALKRAAVKFGLARYLYNSPQVWAESQDAFGGAKFTPAGEQKVKQALASYLTRVGIAARADDVGGQDDDESEPTQPVPQKPTNGNGRQAELTKPLPFAETHEAAVNWGFEQGVFNALPHAQNAYKKLAKDSGWKAGEGSKVTTPELFRLWVVEVENRVAEKNEQKEAA